MKNLGNHASEPTTVNFTFCPPRESGKVDQLQTDRDNRKYMTGEGSSFLDRTERLKESPDTLVLYQIPEGKVSRRQPRIAGGTDVQQVTTGFLPSGYSILLVMLIGHRSTPPLGRFLSLARFARATSK